MKKLFGIIATLAVIFAACSSDDEQDAVISLSQSSYQMAADGSVIVKLEVKNYVGSEINIPVTFSGTAQKGEDYTVSAESFSIGGNAPSEVTFIAKNNYGEDKEIIITLGSLPTGITVGTNNSATISLTAKNYIYYTFTATGYVMNQTAEPTIELKTGNTNYKATEDIVIPIELDTEESTAIEGEHFTFEGSKEIVIKAGSSSGSLSLKWIKNELGKGDIRLKVGEIQHPGILAGLDNSAIIKVLGPVAGQIAGTWQGSSFVNYEWLDLNTSYLDKVELLPTISSADKLTIDGNGINVDMKGDLKNYFRNSNLEYLKEETLVYQEQGYPVVRNKVQTIEIAEVNVNFSSSKTSIRKAVVSFRVFDNNGIKTLEVTIADYEPTDFLMNTYDMVKGWGETPVMSFYPLRFYFTEVPASSEL